MCNNGLHSRIYQSPCAHRLLQIHILCFIYLLLFKSFFFLEQLPYWRPTCELNSVGCVIVAFVQGSDYTHDRETINWDDDE